MEKERTFVEWFFDIAIPGHKNRVYLEADGGFGKTTSLLFIQKTLADNYDKFGMIPIYIDCKDLTSSDTVEKLIVREYCGKDAMLNVDKIYDVLQDNRYKYLLVFDGLNEVNEKTANKLLDDFFASVIGDERKFNNVFIIAASRGEKVINRKFMELEYINIKLSPLDDAVVAVNVKKYIRDPSQELIFVLTNPMMFSIFLNTKDKKEYENVKNQTEVLDTYFDEQIKVVNKGRKYTEAEKKLFKFAISVFLPCLLKENKYSYAKDEIKQQITAIEYNGIFSDFILENNFDEINLDYKKIIYFIRDILKLFSQDRSNLKIHQVFADYFFAKYYAQSITCWIDNPESVPEFALNIQELIDNSENNAIDSYTFYNLYDSVNDSLKSNFTRSVHIVEYSQPQAVYMYQMRRLELEFKLFDIIREKENNILFDYETSIIKAIINILIMGRQKLDDLNFDGLNLTACHFENISLKRCSFNYSLMSKNTFYCTFVNFFPKIKYLDSKYLFLYTDRLICISAENGIVKYNLPNLSWEFGFNRNKFVINIDNNKVEIYDMDSGNKFTSFEVSYVDIVDKKIISIEDVKRFSNQENLKKVHYVHYIDNSENIIVYTDEYIFAFDLFKCFISKYKLKNTEIPYFNEKNQIVLNSNNDISILEFIDNKIVCLETINKKLFFRLKENAKSIFDKYIVINFLGLEIIYSNIYFCMGYLLYKEGLTVYIFNFDSAIRIPGCNGLYWKNFDRGQIILRIETNSKLLDLSKKSVIIQDYDSIGYAQYYFGEKNNVGIVKDESIELIKNNGLKINIPFNKYMNATSFFIQNDTISIKYSQNLINYDMDTKSLRDIDAEKKELKVHIKNESHLLVTDSVSDTWGNKVEVCFNDKIYDTIDIGEFGDVNYKHNDKNSILLLVETNKSTRLYHYNIIMKDFKLIDFIDENSVFYEMGFFERHLYWIVHINELYLLTIISNDSFLKKRICF